MTTHALQWTAPAPLWPALLGGVVEPAGFLQPAILRFASDSFMDDLVSMLDRDPRRVAGLLAQPETWREPLKPVETNLLEPAPALSAQAKQLQRLRLAREHRRQPASAPLAPAKRGSRELDGLKLYQPAHQRYYLASSCLVCQQPGLPDRQVDAGKQERVGFVVRRLLPVSTKIDPNSTPEGAPKDWEEYAWILSPRGGGWRKVLDGASDDAKALVDGEELVAAFPLTYREDDARKRRMFAGLIPVGRREAYLAGPKHTDLTEAKAQAGATPKTARMIAFRTQIAEPWKRLVDLADSTRALTTVTSVPPNEDEDFSGPGLTAFRKSIREQIQVGSWLILLDFAEYLETYLGPVYQAVTSASSQGEGLQEQQQKNLFNALVNTRLPDALLDDLVLSTPFAPQKSQMPRTLRDALAKIEDYREKLEAVTSAYDRSKSGDWPAFLFPLTDMDQSSPWPGSPAPDGSEPDGVALETPIKEPGDPGKLALQANIDKWVALVVRALPKESDAAEPALPLAAKPPLRLSAKSSLNLADGWFRIRFVFDRPECGPLHRALVSEPSAAFRMAGFFDPQAPARPIRIGLPVDTTPAGLRKFDKNAVFMISDVLCGQIQRAKGMTFGDLIRSVLPWPLHKDLSAPDPGPCKSGGVEAGMMCSLSIPIITLCALILLMIMVSLLDIIFRWLPYFIMCFPIPGFRGKK